MIIRNQGLRQHERSIDERIEDILMDYQEGGELHASFVEWVCSCTPRASREDQPIRFFVNNEMIYLTSTYIDIESGERAFWEVGDMRDFVGPELYDEDMREAMYELRDMAMPFQLAVNHMIYDWDQSGLIPSFASTSTLVLDEPDGTGIMMPGY